MSSETQKRFKPNDYEVIQSKFSDWPMTLYGHVQWDMLEPHLLQIYIIARFISK